MFTRASEYRKIYGEIGSKLFDIEDMLLSYGMLFVDEFTQEAIPRLERCRELLGRVKQELSILPELARRDEEELAKLEKELEDE